MESPELCLWQYPLPDDQQDFRLSVPRGAKVLKLIEQETLFGKGFVLLMEVNPLEETGEDVIFHLVPPGLPYANRMVFLGGPMQLGMFLIMDPHRVPHVK